MRVIAWIRGGNLQVVADQIAWRLSMSRNSPRKRKHDLEREHRADWSYRKDICEDKWVARPAMRIDVRESHFPHSETRRETSRDIGNFT